MKPILLFIALTIGLQFSALARVGETNSAIAKRYGAVVSRTDMETNVWAGFYLFKEYKVMVIFKNNTSVCEVISPLEKREFAKSELAALLDAIAGKGKWKTEDGGIAAWQKQLFTNAEARLKAECVDKIMSASQLTVASIEYLASESEKKSADDKKKADGF